MNPFERFYEARQELSTFLGAILEGAGRPELFADRTRLTETLRCLLRKYPFLDLCYALDGEGRQVCDNVVHARHRKRIAAAGAGADRSHRAYYRQALDGGAVLTAPYLSSATREMCVTAAVPVRGRDGGLVGVLVADVDFQRALALLEGDRGRRRLEPVFKAIYALFSLGLLVISLALGAHALLALGAMWSSFSDANTYAAPFQATILLTLALAIFDLAKTIFEEEVLIHKDVRRHSATRRTLTRFIAAILIAISIEALMLVFKFAIDKPDHLRDAAWLIFAAVGLLLGLGVYVFLGAKAEIMLLQHRRTARRQD
ncbi:PDC sensor domain-containing protein [Thermithiobacillus tepidarius DSM 3134]|uniref:PDC sensor domain-containing protein n=1 Tax=Thermithiobacillus tepidarius TaxID=929 RepID=UPI000402EDB5|nr:PDC sensor domain-containing protein [Thermithiobacillus tepidarius]